MIRHAVILDHARPGGAALDSRGLERLTAHVRRHGVEHVRVLAEGEGGLGDVVPQGQDQAFVLDGREVRDINLWDLALAAGAASALAVAPDGVNAGAAVLDRGLMRRLPDGPVFAALDAQADLPRRAYDRPMLNLSAPVVRGAVIFDRDGVLNEDTGYPHRPDHILWTPTAMAAVKAVNDAGLYALVATNQAGIARGFYDEQAVLDLHAWMNGELIAAGAHIDGFDYSPFHPDGVVEAYRRASDCRKPGPRMLNRLIDSFGADRTRTVMVGDRRSDVEAGVAAGVEGLLFEGGDLVAFLAPVIARLAD